MPPTLRVVRLDFADRDSIPACGGDEPGWIADLPITTTVHVQTGSSSTAGASLNSGVAGASLRNVTARVRISAERLCIERLVLGGYVGYDLKAAGGALTPVGTYEITDGDRLAAPGGIVLGLTLGGAFG